MGVNLMLQDQPTPDLGTSPAGQPSSVVIDDFPQQTFLGLLDVFAIHFGAQYPCIDIDELRNQISRGDGSKFLLYCLCGLAAR